MTDTQALKSRSEVNTEETWDLSPLFSDFAAWEKAFHSLPSEEDLESFIDSHYKGKLAESPGRIFECLAYQDELSRKIENLYVYAGLRNAEDVTNQEANQAIGKIEVRASMLMAKFSFLESEILAISSLSQWMDTEPLKFYKTKLTKILRYKPHILSEKEESLLTKIGIPFTFFHSIHEKWNNADLRFPAALDSHGKEHLVTNARYSLNMQSFDRILRKNTFESYYSEISKWRNTITANYNGNMLAIALLAKVRNFQSTLEAELFSDEISPAFYCQLIETVKKYLPLLHRSMAIRKRVLGLETLFPYDRSVSLTQRDKEELFSWEEAKKMVLSAVEPLGEDYVQIATRGLNEERWIDRAENQGKRSGAFSWGTYDSKPYLLQTWTGTLNDVYTLAHELGHSMHSYFSNAHQPYHMAHYTIFVAEVASTLNESLLSHFLLTRFPDTPLARSVLSKNIENFEGTFLRQLLFAAFEHEVSQIVDSGEAFTPDRLETIYLNLNKQWYGEESSTYPDAVRHEWMRIPHFYSAFYVYKYATSYCISLSLTESLKQGPQQAKEKILRLLQAGCSKPPLVLLKEAGVDFLTPQPVENAFENYRRNLEMAETVFNLKSS